MAIKLADTARPNNYVDSEHLGTFPVAYAEDVWFSDGTRLSDKTFDGQSIQKEELPLATADELGNIYQYVGESGTYTNGRFYKCILNSSVYSWSEIKMVENPVVYSETVPDINAYETSSTVCYTGEDSGSFKKGHLYKKLGTETLTEWIDIGGGDAVGGIIDVDTLPTSNIKNTFYRTKEDVGGKTRTVEVSLTSAMSFDEKVAYLSQYFIVHPDQANNRIDIDTYSDLYMTRASWTQHYSVPENTLALMYLDTERIELHYDSNNSGTPHTETSMVVPLLFSSSHFPSAVYYAGDEINQTTERIATYEDIPKEFIGTQAEWDALSQSQKNKYDGKIVNITDDPQGTNLDHYSTNEVKTNKIWVNGKPVYRKCWSDLNISTDETNIGTIDNVDIIVNIEASISQYTSTSGTTLSHKKPYVRSQAEIIVQNNIVRGKSGSGFDRINVVAIEYTKTTD